MADSTYSGDSTTVDGTAVAASTGYASVLAGVYNDGVANLGSGNAGFIRSTIARALHVNLRDATGTALTTGIQYVEDAPLGAVGSGQGTLIEGRASAAAPTSVSADADAVGIWALRNGSLVANLALGGTLVAGATSPVPQRVTDGTAYYTKTGQTAGTASFAQLSDQTTAVNVIAATNALKIDLASVAGTATVTGGVVGSQGVGGTVAHDGVATSINPALLGFYASAAAPADVSLDGDATRGWSLRNGSQVVNLASGGTLITVGQKAMTSSVPVVMASDQSNMPMNIVQYGGTNVVTGGVAGVFSVAGNVASDIPVTSNPLLGGGRASLAVPTAISTDGDAVAVWLDRVGRTTVKQSSGTGTASNVASSATTVTLLAANTSRLGAAIYNDSTQIVYVKLGATASATSYTVQLMPNGMYEAPFGYTGVIDGIWAAANGNARVTELT